MLETSLDDLFHLCLSYYSLVLGSGLLVFIHKPFRHVSLDQIRKMFVASQILVNSLLFLFSISKPKPVGSR